MRTVIAGYTLLRRSPQAALPLLFEGAAVAVLMLVGVVPATGNSVLGAAVFPLDVYFDVKQSLATATGWVPLLVVVAAAVVVRSAVLAATLWLADERAGRFIPVWGRTLRLAALAALALLPSAALLFTGVAIRYAPFVWVAAVLGFVPALILVRLALRLDAGAGTPEGRGVPEAPTLLAYAYLLGAFAAAMTVLGARFGALLPALLLAGLGPVHAMFLLGWREHLRAGSFPGGGTLVTLATVVVVVGLFSTAIYDRYLRRSAPVAAVAERATLLLLGGADSTSTTGALTELDPRDVGFRRDHARVLSYRGLNEPYGVAHTRRDLAEVARIVAAQLRRTRRPRFVLGHSQAALVLDRLLARDLLAPDASVILAAPPPVPPDLEVPPPGERGTGAPGADAARAVAALLALFQGDPFDVDAPAAPANLDAVVVEDAPIRRLSVWPLADSVWLGSDWRRPGEVNIVAVTDHVGVTNNAKALGAARDFFAGRDVEGEDRSLLGLFVSVVRYAFEPWRPALAP